MAELQVSPLPVNYALWYAYACNDSEALNAELDAMIEKRVPPNARESMTLFRKYIGGNTDLEMIGEIAGQIQAAIKQALGTVVKAGGGTQDYSDRLAELSADLVAARQTDGQVENIVRTILRETHGIIERNKALERQLDDSSKEITRLRERVDEVSAEALTDALTGVANRKALDLAMVDAANASSTGKTPLSVLMADIDHFKTFNDTYGHRIGDEVLKVTARVIRSALRPTDFVGRYGGEEFCVILPDADLSLANAIAERVRAGVEARELTNRTREQSYGRITLSIGTAQYRAGEALDNLVQRADSALYRAKRAGRNQVLSETPEATQTPAAEVA